MQVTNSMFNKISITNYFFVKLKFHFHKRTIIIVVGKNEGFGDLEKVFSEMLHNIGYITNK